MKIPSGFHNHCNMQSIEQNESAGGSQVEVPVGYLMKYSTGLFQ